uniref:Chitin-binding type-4 domain-containing protein n=1 Tax=Ciona savignyi TaxID=51511 RepID=H2YE09_CIOSA
MKLSIYSIFLIMAIMRMRGVEGHGRLLEPPSRSSMWRYKRTDPALTPYTDIIQDNYDDNGLNCGGKQTQIDNGGKCGICGDSYTAAVKENEAGGKYALGIITRNYRPGSTIAVEVEITAEHKGYFEFRLCPWNNVGLPVTQECLDQRLLSFADGQTKWYLPEQPELAKGVHELRIQLPSDVTCDQCLLQWRYRTGNSWGYEDSKQGLGLGQQEEFYGCSDVAIKGDLPFPSTLAPTSISTSPAIISEGPATNIAE